MTPGEANLIDYLFEGAEVHYSERQAYIRYGGKAVNTFIAGHLTNGLKLSKCYMSWHIRNEYKGELKILKIVLTDTNRQRINEYLAKQ